MDEKIEPTDAMVNKAANALALEATGTALHLQSDAAKHTYRHRARVALRVVLNHPDAADADRPWEPLSGRPVRVGYEVRQDLIGLTTTAIVGRVDQDGDLCTAEGGFIGNIWSGSWYVRRPAIQELPTKRRTVIIANDGHEYIEAVVSGVIWRTSEAILGLGGRWHGVWRAGPVAVGSTSSDSITPGTWKVDDR